MPPLTVFGRQWRMSSDDLVCPALTELLIRVGWVIVVSTVIIFHVRESKALQCLGEEYEESTYYLTITLGLLLVTCIHMVLLASHSAKGSLSDDKPRHWVPFLIYVNVFLTTAELLWTVAGTYLTVHDYLSCKDEEKARRAIVAVLAVMALSYILIGIKITTALLSFRPSESTSQALNYRSLRCLMPCTRDESAVQAFRDIANLLGKILHDPNIVPSDLVAGLILLHQKHRLRKNDLEIVKVDTLVEVGGLSVATVGQAGDGLSPDCVGFQLVDTSPGDHMSWQKIKHFFSFASAAYGYWWYMMQAPCSHACSLGTYLNCFPWMCCFREKLEYLVEGDGMFHFNTAAMRAMLKIPGEDIVVVDNRNNLQEVPFFLIADRSSQSLVISIRGTLSLVDMLTDLRGEPIAISSCCDEDLGLDPGWQGHEGMCRAANYVYKRLHESPKGESIPLLTQALGQTNYKDIVVTGHSLGAGTAAILAFLLRAKYPQLGVTCYSYSPPGGLISRDAALESERFCVSVVVGDDVIPRTSLHNIVSLSESIRRICKSCALPKYKLFGYGLLGCCCAPHVDLEYEVNRLFPSSSKSSSTPSTPNISTRDGSSSRDPILPADRVSSPSHTHPLSIVDTMVPPGRVIHITADEEGGFSVAEVAKTSFDEILISTRMLADHMPNYLHEVFAYFCQSPTIAPMRT